MNLIEALVEIKRLKKLVGAERSAKRKAQKDRDRWRKETMALRAQLRHATKQLSQK